ncbi:MAG: protein phosphatase 1 regulatory subunit 42 [Mollicutes bacterium UO1]
MKNAQQYLENKYPLFIRQRIKKLNLSNRGLAGILDLKDFKNLEILDCSHNYLTEISSLEKTNLKKLDASNNCLTNFNPQFCPGLEMADLSNNYFIRSDLVLIKKRPLDKENEPLPSPKRQKPIEIVDLLDDYLLPSPREEKENVPPLSPLTQSNLARLQALRGEMPCLCLE